MEYINTQGDTINDPLVADNEISLKQEGNRLIVSTEAVFKQDLRLLRLAYILPLPEGQLTVSGATNTLIQPFFNRHITLTVKVLA